MKTVSLVILLLSSLAVIACSSPTPEPPAATPNVAAAGTGAKSEEETEPRIRAVPPTESPGLTPEPTPTPDVPASVPAATAEAPPTATPTPIATPTATPRPEATPTFNQWLHREMSKIECEDPQDKLTWDNAKPAQPYSADFRCVSPTPTPQPAATELPTPAPTQLPIPQDRESRLAAITVLITTSDGSGTGFFAVTEDEGRWFVFTNEHMARGHETVSVYWHLAKETVTGAVIKSNANLDIAILDIQPSDFGSYTGGWDGFSYGSNNYDKGDEVWIAGYPGDMGQRQGKAPVVRQGAIHRKSLQRYSDGVSFLELSVNTAPGSSGSPVVNGSGQVIAINAAHDNGAERIGLAVPLWAIYRWLETGDEPGSRHSILERPDGAYLAVLAWEENGLQKAMTTAQGNYCLTQVWETDLANEGKWYRWQDLCENGLEGIEREDGEIYFEHSGTTYRAPIIILAEKPN